jgi:hypothetical protein
VDAAAEVSSRRTQRIVRDVVVVVVALAVGFGAAAAYSALRDRGSRGGASAPRSRSGATSGHGAVPGFQPDATSRNVGSSGSTDDAPAPAARTPRDAVASFLAFESHDDFASSFGVLAAPDRASVRSRSEWIDAHEHLAPITGFEILNVDVASDHADVHAELNLRAGLDFVTGDTAPRADADLVALPEDGGWRVAYARSRITPQYAPDAGAADAARSWASWRQRCHTDGEMAGGLLGATYVADRLCHSRGAVETGAVTELPDSPAVEPFLAAFGPEVGEWARIVPLQSPVAMDVVTAPVGESWLVIGVLEASPGSGS